MKKLLFSFKPVNTNTGLLLFRMLLGCTMLLAHGWGKLTAFGSFSDRFFDFLGLGPTISLALTVFAEVFCSALVALGLFTRLALIPLAVTMSVAVFIIHADDPFGKQELGLLYLGGYVLLFFTGPGKYSADYLIHR